METNNPLVTKSENFALHIVELGKTLIDKKEFVLSKQILKSGTSIGANIAEAQYAESRKDFASKLSIALKEARETKYWLQLLQKSAYIPASDAAMFQTKLAEILAMLVASIKTTKQI